MGNLVVLGQFFAGLGDFFLGLGILLLACSAFYFASVYSKK